MDMVKTITVDGKRFEFICHSWGTRSGFAHGVEMIDMENYTIMAEAKLFYLNRTWECWDFQSAMLGAIRKAQNNEVTRVWNDLQRTNGWQKITAKRREALDKALAESEYFATLKALYEEVSKNRPAWDY